MAGIMTTQRLISGIQPTGKMHLGNYFGAIQNWVALQESYESYFMIADYHALTTVYENPGKLREDKHELVLDLLGAGVDPEKAVLFYQSSVPEHCELHLILSMVTPLPWLTRVPTYKSKMDAIEDKDLHTYGFLGYPVLQTADILLYKGTVVPVGQDQLPHLELAREITRRFNHLIKPLFPEPEAKLTTIPVLVGTDGRKMSKSYNNTLPLSDTPEQTTQKVMRMVTDPQRVKRTDPGNPDVCSVFSYHKLLNTSDRQTAIAAACRSAEIGCVDCKRECASVLNTTLSAFRERRARFESQPDHVQEILVEGGKKAQRLAQHTLAEVKSAIGL